MGRQFMGSKCEGVSIPFRQYVPEYNFNQCQGAKEIYLLAQKPDCSALQKQALRILSSTGFKRQPELHSDVWLKPKKIGSPIFNAIDGIALFPIAGELRVRAERGETIEDRMVAAEQLLLDLDLSSGLRLPKDHRITVVLQQDGRITELEKGAVFGVVGFVWVQAVERSRAVLPHASRSKPLLMRRPRRARQVHARWAA